jgi:hypothetical protein
VGRVGGHNYLRAEHLRQVSSADLSAARTIHLQEGGRRGGALRGGATQDHIRSGGIGPQSWDDCHE